MPRKPNPVPTYRLHKQSGQAVVTVRDPDGRRRDVMLGRYGSPESKAEYARVLASLRQPASERPGRSTLPSWSPPRAGGLTVNELLLAYMRHAAGYYVGPDGQPTSELANLKDAIRPVRLLFGTAPASEFGPLALKVVRQHMIDAGHCRTAVNARTNRVRRVFKWAAGEELIPFDVYHRLTAVTGLGKGRTMAPEREPVRPVDEATVRATLPFLNRHVAAMVRVQLLSGMRPGEACRMTAADIDRSGPVWTYSPATHKTGYRGHVRRVKLGPQSQAVLTPFLAAATDPAAPLFSPRKAREERYAAMRAGRRTKVQPSQVCRRKAMPERSVPDGYAPRGYATMIGLAVRKANARRERVAGRGNYDPVPHWAPNQLRHAHGTAVRRLYGLESAGASLGHSKMSATEIYAERDEGLAERVAGEIG